MTIQDYFEALVGQYLEVAGTTALNQCVDSVNFYIKFVLGLPPIEWTNAVDFPEKASKENYEWILNTDTNKPTEGDIIVWKGAIGHIAVVFSDKATTQKFWSFDQNWPTYSSCRVVEHSYSNVRGWLRPKSIPTNYEVLFNKKRVECDQNWNMLLDVQKALAILGDYIHKTVLDRIDSLVSTEREYGKQQTSLVEANEKVKKLEDRITSLEPKQDKATKDVQENGQKLEEVKQDIKDVKEIISQPDWSGWKLITEGLKKLFNL